MPGSGFVLLLSAVLVSTTLDPERAAAQGGDKTGSARSGEAGSEKAGPQATGERWNAPFGGTFSADFTLASEYNYAGISNTMGQPAYQFGFGYSTPTFLDGGPPVWLHLYSWSSNVRYPAVGEAFEVDLGASLKTRLIGDRLKLDLGYVRYFYPGTPVELAYAYSEYTFTAEYDLGPLYVSARIRHSDDFFGQSGQSWNKRRRVGVPLDFLKLPKDVSIEAYGTLGNFWVDNFIRDGLPGNEYTYWQFGLTTVAFGLEFHAAYVGTSISHEGCAYTNYCSDRLFFSVTKSF
jgi:uncharacterized protein (TIGR02001 family)